jgi:hypothetical protein
LWDLAQALSGLVKGLAVVAADQVIMDQECGFETEKHPYPCPKT